MGVILVETAYDFVTFRHGAAKLASTETEKTVINPINNDGDYCSIRLVA